MDISGAHGADAMPIFADQFEATYFGQSGNTGWWKILGFFYPSAFRLGMQTMDKP
jgi:hypothetical protein